MAARLRWDSARRPEAFSTRVTFGSISDSDYKFTSSDPLFAEISISNTDRGGTAYDNIPFGANATGSPEAASMILFGSGLLGLPAYRRFQKTA